MLTAHDSLTLQMLEWISQGAHRYCDVIDVWKSSCPRLTIWEDACADGLVESGPGRIGIVSLTAKGKKILQQG
jgi:hypothetical protein